MRIQLFMQTDGEGLECVSGGRDAGRGREGRGGELGEAESGEGEVAGAGVRCL